MRTSPPTGFAIAAAAVALAGTLVSGQAGLLFAAEAPRMPFIFGFLLVGGFVALFAGLQPHADAEIADRVRAARAFGAAFGAIIVANYAIQVTLVPSLSESPESIDRLLASRLSMADPASLGWALEMWGYAVLGVATWLCAPVFHGDRIERSAATLFAANGPISIAGALLTTRSPTRVQQPAGLAAYAIWNVLVVAMLALALAALHRRGGARDAAIA